MRSTKLKRKLLAGILCAAMVFQSVPIEAVATEAQETVQYEDSGEQHTTEEETQAGTTVLAASEDSEQGTDADIVSVAESLAGTDTVQTPSETFGGTQTEETATAEAPSAAQTVETPEAPSVEESAETPEEPSVEESAETPEEPSVEESAETSGESEETEWTETDEELMELETPDTDPTESASSTPSDPPEVMNRPDYNKLLSVVTEKKYYFYESVEEIFLKMEGCEIPAEDSTDVDIELYIDEEPVDPDKSDLTAKVGYDLLENGYYRIDLRSKNLSEGLHRLSVKFKDVNPNSSKKNQYLVIRDIEFEIEKVDNVFTEAERYFLASSDDSIEVAFFNVKDDIKSVKITASNGDIVALSGEERSKAVPQKKDPRYTGIGDGYEYSDNILNKTTWVLTTEKNALEVGNYDIRLTNDKGEERMIPNIVEVSSRAVVTKCALGTDYDNTSGLLYLYIQGSGFSPAQVRFDFEDVATKAPLSTTRVDYKTVQSGYIVKFRKEGGWSTAGRDIKVKLVKRTGIGNIDFTQTEFEAMLESGIYYAEYNGAVGAVGAVEVGVTTDLNGNSVSFKIVDTTEQHNEVSTVTSRALTESLAYLTPEKELTRGERYCVELTANGKKYYKEFMVSQGAPSTDHWEAAKVISQNTEWHDFYYCTTESGIKSDDIKATISGYSNEVAVYASEWLREDGGKGTRIQIWIPTQKLSTGSHTVTLTKNGSAYTSYTFTVIAAEYDQFVLDTYSLSWIDDNTIQVYIKTPNCTETDDFEIKLTGTNDNNPVETSAVVTERYKDSLFMNITGLSRTSAFKEYYVLITHKEYGLPVKMTDLSKSYYDDEIKGEKISITSNKGLPVISNNRMIGLNIQSVALPATLTVYATDTTEVITTLTIPSTVEGNYYYFTKAFYDSLANKDRLYDLTLSDDGGNWGRSYARVNIGYKGEETVNDFDVKISSDVLFVDGTESGKTAVITVSGNKQKPVFEVSEDEVIALEDYVEVDEATGTETIDPNKKRVVAKETGTSSITVIADGVTKSLFVTVTRYASGISLNTADRGMKVGDSFEAEAYILPMSAEDSSQVVNFTSSDPSVLIVRKLTNTTARVTALKAGTAVLRANLQGTTYAVAVTITITDTLPLYDKKEIKIKEVGIVSYIDNVDRALSYCELPKGWEWKDGDQSLSVNDELQYCWATYTEEGYQPFDARLPVAVARITGVEVTGRKLINRGQKEEYKISYLYTGADINTPKFRSRLTQNCVKTSETNLASVEKLEWGSMIIAAAENTKGGTVDFSLTLAIDGGTSTNIDLFSQDFQIEVPLTDCVNHVKVKPIRAGGQGFEYKESDDFMGIDQRDVRDAKNKYSVELEAVATINGKPAKNIKFNWQTSDKNIAMVGVNEEGAVILTVKKEGTVDITATADDQGQCMGTLTVNIMDYAPVLESASVTINKYRISGTDFILQEQNGNSITGVNVIEGEANSLNFIVDKPVEGIATLRLKDNAPLLAATKKTVTNCKLEVVTAKGKYPYTLKVTTEVTKPAVTLKVKNKANLFYKNAAAVYTVSSKDEIDNIKITGAEGNVGFEGRYDRSSSTIRFEAKGLDNSTASQFSSKSPSLNVQLEIRFTDYREPQNMQVKVATENKKPSLAMTGMVLCPGVTTGDVTIINSKTKELLPLDSAMKFEIIKPLNSGIGATLNSRNNNITLGYLGTKSVSYTAQLDSPEWTQPVSAKGKITYITSPEKLSLVLGQKQVTLNMATNINANGRIEVPVSVNNSDIRIDELQFSGTAIKLMGDNGYLYCDDVPSAQGIKAVELGLNEGKCGAVKPGTYKLEIRAAVRVADQKYTIKKTVLTIKLTEIGSAKVKFASPKGKINLIDRENTSVVYTPKVSGVDSTVESVRVTGENAQYFTATLNADNKVEVKAIDGKLMSVKDTYNVNIQSTLKNRLTIDSAVKIKPVNKLPKLVFTPAKCSLYRSNSNRYTTTLLLKNSEIDMEDITSIRIDTGSKTNADSFLLVNNVKKDGTVSFNLAGDRLRIKKGQYKVKCLVTFRDADPESKPAAVTMTITVK